MAKNPLLVIDIGQNRVKVLELALSGKSGVKIVKSGSETLSLDPKAEQAEIYQRIQETLPLLLQSLGIKQKRAIVSLPGRAAFTRRLQVPVVRGRQLNRIIRYEARQHVPFPLEEINMDYEVGKRDEQSAELDINLVAVRKEIADGYVRVLKKCGIRADLIEAAPLSIYNAYAATPHRDPEEVTAVVSIGASSTDIVVEQNGKMQFMRSAPVAGAFLTELLVKKFDITAEQAEEYKCKQADQYTGSDVITAEDVAGVLEGGFERIVTEVQRSFDFYVSQPDAMPVTRVFVCGGTVNMDGVGEFLEDRLGVPVSQLDTSEIEGIEASPENAGALNNEAALAGMAVRVGGRAACALSFAPASVKQRLELERRTPILSVMGVILVVMLAGAVFALNTWVEKQAQAVEQMQQIISPGDLANPELKKQREIQDKYNNRYSRIFQVASKRGVLSRIYLEVQEMLPQDIWLDSIDVKSDRLTIEGRALNDMKIAAYIQNLSLSPFFDNETVLLENAVYSSDSSGDSSQVEFTIQIVAFNDPTDAEIKFIDELRSRMADSTIVAIRIIRPENSAPDADASLLVGLYQTEFSDDKSRLALFNKIDKALAAAQFDVVKTIELRMHGGKNDERERMIITRDKLANFGEGSLGPEEFKQTFTLVTPSPSPTPSPTPTPDLEDGDSSGGMYGGMMYGGMMGMGGMGMGMMGQ
ncbi:MAG: type IV pilus assembly protein PilM [Candidatus Hinthialibacter antarcticus]|nr:type IV pilus assembly protein PilM [Candidatus Hinthialibacter antarcticus]